MNCNLVIYQASEFYLSEEISIIMFANIPQLPYIKSLVIISMTFQINSEKQKQTNPQEKPYLQKKRNQPETWV